MTTKRTNHLFWPATAAILMLLVAACKPGAIPADLNAGQPFEATQSATATADSSEGGITGAVEAMGPAAWTISGKVFEVTPETAIKDDIQVGDLVKAQVEPGTSRLMAVSLATDSEAVNDNDNGNDDNENVNENENEADDDGDEVNEQENENDNDNESISENENENGDDENENVSENDNADDENEQVGENENDDDKGGGNHDKGNDNGKGNDDGGDHENGDD
jgi:hypothetical protein